MSALETHGLSRTFGPIRALDGVDLVLPRGETLALFGPNGAGKTTLLRILTLGLRPTDGTFKVAGHDPRREDRQIRQNIGVVSHQSFLYDDLTARQNLEFFGELYGVERPSERALELLADVGLEHRADDPLRTFSRGMQQRVSLVRALVHDPVVVFLDEPFTGLDPLAARMLRQTLEGLRRRGRSWILVTHHLSQGIALSDRWALLSRGRVVDQGRSDQTDGREFEASYFERFEDDRSRRAPA